MRFLADIPIGRSTIEYLKGSGHDVLRVSDRLSATASDSEIVRLAVAESRIVLCFDLGVAQLVALSGKQLPSIVTLRMTRQSALFVNERLGAVLPMIAEELDRGALAAVEDFRVRVRSLPILSPPRE